MPSLAAELVRLKVDVIVAASTAAARAAQQATTTIPVLCFLMGDPIGEQLVTSLARPGGNVTGFTVLAPELVPKCLALLKEALPRVSRVAALWQPGTFTERTAGNILQSAEAAARTLGIELRPVSVRDAKDLDRAFATMATERADALLVLPGPLSFGERQRIVDLPALHRLPSMSWNRVFVEGGGFLSYGVNYNNQVRRGATYVDKILKGAKPADLPVEQPTKFELVLNLKTAKTLGLEYQHRCSRAQMR